MLHASLKLILKLMNLMGKQNIACKLGVITFLGDYLEQRVLDSVKNFFFGCGKNIHFTTPNTMFFQQLQNSLFLLRVCLQGEERGMCVYLSKVGVGSGEINEFP